MVIKNLENKIKLVIIICGIFIVGAIIISIASMVTAANMVNESHKRIYVLDGNVPIIVSRTDMSETLEIEARSHIERFHNMFFTLVPDDKYIRTNIDRALYMVDETGLAQYNALKEKGFYSSIMGASAMCSIMCDSINLNMDDMTFTYYGRQRIERRTTTIIRELVTTGGLKKVPRSDNNPHGLMIVNWRTLVNRDIEQKAKPNY
ncbi:MAG: conjugative transposon protein TraK [Bacteroidales bacterium]|nr:conjugative transposon protein TraK [Bacteroidales bacterium]